MEAPPDKSFVDLLVWVCGGLVGLVVSIQQKIISQYGRDITQLQQDMAAEKAKREETSAAITLLRQSMERGLERLYDKLDGKEDKQ